MSEREKIYFLMFSDATISDVISIYDDSKCTLSDESHSDRSVRLIDVMRLWSGSRELFRATYTDDVQIDLNHRGDMIEFFLPATEPLELEIKSGDPIASKGPVAISGSDCRVMRISGGRQQVRIGISRRRFNTILTDIIRAPLEKPLEFTPTPSLDAPVLRTILSLVNACFIIGQETSSDEEKARALLDTLELTLLNFWPNNFANDFTSAGGAVMPHHVRLAMELIQGDPFAKLDVHSLAKSTGVSVRTLQHNFRKFRSCSITEYILECRMRRLHDNRNSPGFINDVAESVGPNAMSRMRQIFRARFGRDLLQS